jgi:hypothetical protein
MHDALKEGKPSTQKLLKIIAQAPCVLREAITSLALSKLSLSDNNICAKELYDEILQINSTVATNIVFIYQNFIINERLNNFDQSSLCLDEIDSYCKEHPQSSIARNIARLAHTCKFHNIISKNCAGNPLDHIEFLSEAERVVYSAISNTQAQSTSASHISLDAIEDFSTDGATTTRNPTTYRAGWY